MDNQFFLNTSALVYNDNFDFLLIKRSANETHLPGIYTYPGGKSEFTAAEMDFLEKNVKREVLEETGAKITQIEYLLSEIFVKETGEKVAHVSFIAKYVEDDPTHNSDEVEKKVWMNIDQILNLEETIPIVKKIYKAGFEKIRRLRQLHRIEVAGIVLNDSQEYLLIKDSVTNKYRFPVSPVIDFPGSTWEILEKNLANFLKQTTGIEIADGAIPFTDNAFRGPGGFDSIIEFYICRQKSGTDSSTLTSDIGTWVAFENLKQIPMDELVYQALEKAHQFINHLSSM